MGDLDDLDRPTLTEEQLWEYLHFDEICRCRVAQSNGLC